MQNPLKDERLIQGLMGLWNFDDLKDIASLISFDLDHGIHFFDISDIYSSGRCEEKLGSVLKDNPSLREKMIIQTKVGLRRVSSGEHANYYDLSYDHIMEGAEASLKRMGISYIDYYLLHRPDILMDNKEIARAFKELKASGKVRHFGVSNFSPEAIEYLASATDIPLEINQLQLGLGHLDLVSEIVNTNVDNKEGTPFGLDLFFYTKRKGMALQCWSPNLYGSQRTSIYTEPALINLQNKMKELAAKYSVSSPAIANAFLFQLGDNVQVVTGAINQKHILEALDGLKVHLTKEEFYSLYTSSGNLLP